MCLNCTKDLGRVGRKWKMINIQVTLRLRKPTKTFRKSVKLFTKIDVWVWEWLQIWLVINRKPVRQILRQTSGRISGRTKSGCCTRTMPQLTTPFCSRSFFPINAFEYLMAHLLNGLGVDELYHCFEQWRTWMQRCVDKEEEYIEGDELNCKILWINQIFAPVSILNCRILYILYTSVKCYPSTVHNLFSMESNGVDISKNIRPRCNINCMSFFVVYQMLTTCLYNGYSIIIHNALEFLLLDINVF